MTSTEYYLPRSLGKVQKGMQVIHRKVRIEEMLQHPRHLLLTIHASHDSPKRMKTERSPHSKETREKEKHVGL